MKALMGANTEIETVRLLDEIRSLRQRVDELEAALEEAETVRDEASVATAQRFEVDVRGELVEAGA